MTTVAVDDDAQRRLAHLKEDWGLSSMNDVVHRLLDIAQEIPASMYGVDRELPPLSREARDEMWE